MAKVEESDGFEALVYSEIFAKFYFQKIITNKDNELRILKRFFVRTSLNEYQNV